MIISQLEARMFLRKNRGIPLVGTLKSATVQQGTGGSCLFTQTWKFMIVTMERHSEAIFIFRKKIVYLENPEEVMTIMNKKRKYQFKEKFIFLYHSRLEETLSQIKRFCTLTNQQSSGLSDQLLVKSIQMGDLVLPIMVTLESL